MSNRRRSVGCILKGTEILGANLDAVARKPENFFEFSSEGWSRSMAKEMRESERTKRAKRVYADHTTRTGTLRGLTFSAFEIIRTAAKNNWAVDIEAAFFFLVGGKN